MIPIAIEDDCYSTGSFGGTGILPMQLRSGTGPYGDINEVGWEGKLNRFRAIVGSEFIYKLNKEGESTPSCGTPCFRIRG